MAMAELAGNIAGAYGLFVGVCAIALVAHLFWTSN